MMASQFTIEQIIPLITGHELTAREIARGLRAPGRQTVMEINSMLYAAERHGFYPGLQKIVDPVISTNAPKWTFVPPRNEEDDDGISLPEATYELILVDYFTCGADLLQHIHKYPDVDIIHYCPSQQTINLREQPHYKPVFIPYNIAFAITWKVAQAVYDGIKRIKIISNNRQLRESINALAAEEEDVIIECSNTV